MECKKFFFPFFSLKKYKLCHKSMIKRTRIKSKQIIPLASYKRITYAYDDVLSMDSIIYIFLLIFFSGLCIGIGIFFLLRTGGRADVLHNTDKQNSQEDASEVAATVVEKILAKKGLLIDQWRKTN